MKNKKLRKASGGMTFNGDVATNGTSKLVDNSKNRKIDNSELTKYTSSKSLKIDVDATIPV